VTAIWSDLSPAYADADTQACEFRLHIISDPNPDVPATIVFYRADGLAAAIAQGRRFLAAADGPDDRYAELYQRNGNHGDHLTDIHLGG
jgi:hypothetical protein